MKICILKESLCLGGTERSAANISRILSDRHKVYLAVYDGKQIKYPYGGQLVDFSIPPRRNVLLKILNTFRRESKYKRLIAEKQIDILFEFISINNPISKIRRRNVIRIISSRDFSVMESCKDRFHRCLSAADAMVCNSNYLREFYTNQFPEHCDRVFTMYNVIESEEISRQAKENIEPEFSEFLAKHSKTIVSVGRFCKEKGFEFLLDALAQVQKEFPELGLVLVGDGADRDKYEAMIKELHLEKNVYFTGFQSNPYRYMARCDAFVLSSLSEGFPNVLPEAMALGLPVIADNCFSGPAEILRCDQDYTAVKDTFVECDFGILTPALRAENNKHAVDELAHAILFLLSNEEKAKFYSDKARERVQSFSPQAAQRKLEEIFTQLLTMQNKNC